jgi:hypothetical protein
MALETRTIQQVNDLIYNQLEAQFAKTFPLFPKSFIRYLSKTLAGVFIILYKTNGWIFKQLFVQFASFEDVTINGKVINPLKEWGRLVGVGDPNEATQAELTISLVVNSIGETLFAGTQFTNTTNGVIYITQQNYTLSANPTAVQVIATTAGTIGNLTPGTDILTAVNTLGIIENDATITTLDTTAVAAETETNYRRRIIERFQLQPQGGAYADYRIWASEVPGVLQTYIYAGDPPSNVLIYVAGVPASYVDRVADSALLLAVANAVEYDPDTGVADRRPIGAVIDPDGDGSYSNIESITNVTFDIEITSLVVDDEVIDDVKENIYNSLDDYMQDREPFIEGLSIPPKKGTVTQANVIGIVNDIVQAQSGTFLTAIVSISSVISTNYSLQMGELAKLGVLTINGVTYTP